MPSIIKEFKEALCQGITLFQQQQRVLPEETRNAIEQLLKIIVSQSYAPKLRNDLIDFTEQLPTKWYSFLPGVEDTMKDLKIMLLKILMHPPFRQHNLLYRAGAETQEETIQLTYVVKELQEENERLKSAKPTQQELQAAHMEGEAIGFTQAKNVRRLHGAI